MIFEKYGNDFDVKTNCKLFNPVSDRDFWDNISPRAVSYFENELKLYENKERQLLTARLYREYFENGNRTNYENIYFSRRSELVAKTILECVYNDDRYMNDILDLVWLILEETTWTVPAHNVFVKEADSLPDFKKHTLDLFLAETASVMAFVYQLIGEKLDKISNIPTRRIKERIRTDLTENYLSRDDYWWMGFGEAIPNNWNPWINSNVLASVMVTEDNEETLKKVVCKVIETLDIYLKNYPLDGGCDEGPVYWNQAGLSMLECLWLLNIVTGGKIDCFSEEKVINTSEYFMKMYVGKGRVINYADSSVNCTANVASIFKMSEIMNSKKLADFAKNTYEELKDTISFRPYDIINKYGGYDGFTKNFRMFDICKYLGKLESYLSEENNFDLDYWLPNIEVMISKNDFKGEKGFVFSAKGGHNAESHNHNDVGNFIVYKNGVPFIIDSGNMTYQKITFSDKRYTLWTTRSSYHNTPTVNGFEQKDGREYFAKNVFYKKTEDKIVFSLDLKNTFENRENINKWIRTVEFYKKEQKIIVTEDFSFDKEYDYTLNFITPQNVRTGEKSITLISENKEKLSLDFEDDFKAFTEKIDYTDKLITANWGKALYRVTLTDRAKEKIIKYTIK